MAIYESSGTPSPVVATNRIQTLTILRIFLQLGVHPHQLFMIPVYMYLCTYLGVWDHVVSKGVINQARVRNENK